MTNIERKALGLVNEVAQDVRYEPDDFEEERRDVFKALCRAVEQHETFRQVVHCEMLEYRKWCKSVGLEFPLLLERFIIAKPDPLVDALCDIGLGWFETAGDELRAALAKRGGRIVFDD